MNKIEAKIEQLKSTYPLPLGWEIVQSVEHRATIAGVEIFLCGLAANSKSNKTQAVGSAGDPTAIPCERAYFELLERICILIAEKNKKHCKSFPTSPEPNIWQYSKSNGVAVGKNFSDASTRAQLELLERHWLLKSWYEQSAPKQITGLSSTVSPLNREYELFLAEFSTTPSVVGLFGFPKKSGKPFLYGLAAAENRQQAIFKAENEFLQRLGFLWEEEIETDQLDFAATPMFHQEYYLSKERSKIIRKWLFGAKNSVQPTNPSETLKTASSMELADITPDSLSGKLSVVKATSSKLLPLTFGKFNPSVKNLEDPSLWIHPIA